MTDQVERFAGLSGRMYPVAPEEALLFLGARLSSPPEDDDRLRALCQRPLDWEAVRVLCDRHGVTGLVRRRLLETGAWAHVPRPQRQAMDRWQLARRGMHATINNQLDEILGACAEQQIVPVVMKGAALAATVYPDPALRSMADIDLLVPVETMPRLGEVMARLGYQRQGLYYSDEFNASHGYHLLFRHSAGRQLAVEVHWELASRPERRNRLTAGTLLAHSVTANDAATATNWIRHARVLTPEAQVLYLATHMASEGHAFGRLIWLDDMATTIAATPSLDWLATAVFARQVRVRCATAVALALTQSLLGAHAHPRVPDSLLPGMPTEYIGDRAVNPGLFLKPVDGRRRALIKYLVVDSPAITTRLFRERLFPDPSVMQTYCGAAGPAGLGAGYIRHAVGVSRAAIHQVLPRRPVDAVHCD